MFGYVYGFRRNITNIRNILSIYSNWYNLFWFFNNIRRICSYAAHVLAELTLIVIMTMIMYSVILLQHNTLFNNLYRRIFDKFLWRCSGFDFESATFVIISGILKYKSSWLFQRRLSSLFHINILFLWQIKNQRWILLFFYLFVYFGNCQSLLDFAWRAMAEIVVFGRDVIAWQAIWTKCILAS